MILQQINEQIKEKQLELLNLERRLAELKKLKEQKIKEQKEIEASIWKEIAFNKELKNENQRKAKFQELIQSNKKYQEIEKSIEVAEDEISSAIYEVKKIQIEIEFLKRNYEIELTFLKEGQEV